MNNYPMITSLHLYPIKSCAGISVANAHVNERGLNAGGIRDRSWMLVDENNVFISQRTEPTLALIKVDIFPDGLIKRMLQVTAPGMEPMFLRESDVGGESEKLLIHKKEVVAHGASEAAHAWFSAYLGAGVRLMHQTEADHRACNPAFAAGHEVGFADGYAYLVTNEATLAKLNRGLEQRVPMDRFRPNIVVGGIHAEAEYGWQQIRINSAVLDFVKPCDRCVVTTVDQQTGQKTGNEPLRTLVETSFLDQGEGDKRVRGAIFGENAQASQYGRIAVGDPVSILAEKQAYHFTPLKKRAPAPHP